MCADSPSELSQKSTCEAKNGLVSASNIAAADTILAFFVTALVVPNGFAVSVSRLPTHAVATAQSIAYSRIKSEKHPTKVRSLSLIEHILLSILVP